MEAKPLRPEAANNLSVVLGKALRCATQIFPSALSASPREPKHLSFHAEPRRTRRLGLNQLEDITGAA